MSDADATGQRIGEFFGDVSAEISALMRRELSVAREQAAERLRRSAAGIGLAAAAAALGGVALGTATAGLVRALDRALPGRNGALAVTLLSSGLAGICAVIGAQEIRRHAFAVPQEAAQAVLDDVGSSEGGVAGRSR